MRESTNTALQPKNKPTEYATDILIGSFIRRRRIKCNGDETRHFHTKIAVL